MGSLAAAAGLKLFYSFYSHFVCYSKAWFASVIQQRGTQRIPQRLRCGSQFYIVNVTLLQLCLKGLMVSAHLFMKTVVTMCLLFMFLSRYTPYLQEQNNVLCAYEHC